jgi:hypothetical protein
MRSASGGNCEAHERDRNGRREEPTISDERARESELRVNVPEDRNPHERAGHDTDEGCDAEQPRHGVASRLTMSLSGRAHGVAARHERKIAQRAHGA